MTDLFSAVWDVVIVGGGSAGCVLANRLSTEPSRKVLLVEAGRDLPPGREGSAILDMHPARAAFAPDNLWPNLLVRTSPGTETGDAAPARFYEQARLMGGGSSINGQVANRGAPADYDDWAALGAAGWGWSDVLPYFNKVERDLDFAGPLHGAEGRVPIHRIPRSVWSPVSLAAETALGVLGYRDIEDQNAVFDDGYFPLPLSNDGRHRVSASTAYLDASTRRRANLAILPDAHALNVVFDGRKTTGVRVSHRGTAHVIRAAHVILSAGALHSPAILLRSGVGPGRDLGKLGLDVVANREGVGANLQEHPGASVSAYLRPRARMDDRTRRHIQLGLRYSSNIAGAEPSDMFMMVAAKSAWHPLGRRIGTVMSWINKAHSRGRVAIADADPFRPPLVSFSLLSDPRDAKRLGVAMRFMAELLATQPLSDVTMWPGPSNYSGFAKALGRRTIRNYLMTAPLALAVDALPPLRREFFRRAVSNNVSLSSLLRDEDILEAYVKAHALGLWHPCGTCRMGPAGDPAAVVDPATGMIHGAQNLGVVDASIMPTAPRANLNLPVMMMAERMSDLIARNLRATS